MGAKIKDFQNGHWLFWCPGCGEPHPYQVPRWTWNGSLEAPTFTPSLLVHGDTRCVPPRPRCHLFVTDGKIHYCSDCEHAMAGQTVDVPDWDACPWARDEEPGEGPSALDADHPTGTEQERKGSP